MRIANGFGFEPGKLLTDKYEIIGLLGRGWEGEVYLVKETATGIERAAKFFFPQRNPRDRTLRFYARKLHKLRHCPIVIQYHTQDSIDFQGVRITFLVSDFVEGLLLEDFLKHQRGGRLTAFQGLHLLHSLASGMESIHSMGEYHGDLHPGNVIVQRYGLGFDLKVLDLLNWGDRRPVNIRNDVLDMIRLFYDAIGGARHYARQPQEVKAICCGLKHSLIFKKFKTAGQLRVYLETMQWQ